MGSYSNPIFVEEESLTLGTYGKPIFVDETLGEQKPIYGNIVSQVDAVLDSLVEQNPVCGNLVDTIDYVLLGECKKALQQEMDSKKVLVAGWKVGEKIEGKSDLETRQKLKRVKTLLQMARVKKQHENVESRVSALKKHAEQDEGPESAARMREMNEMASCPENVVMNELESLGFHFSGDENSILDLLDPGLDDLKLISSIEQVEPIDAKTERVDPSGRLDPPTEWENGPSDERDEITFVDDMQKPPEKQQTEKLHAPIKRSSKTSRISSMLEVVYEEDYTPVDDGHPTKAE